VQSGQPTGHSLLLGRALSTPRAARSTVPVVQCKFEEVDNQSQAAYETQRCRHRLQAVPRGNETRPSEPHSAPMHFQYAAAGGQDIEDPVAIPAVRKTDQVAASARESVYRRAVLPARLPPRMDDKGEGRQIRHEKAQDAIRRPSIEARHRAW